MPLIYQIILVVHIASGFLCLLFGLIAMISAKGSILHIRSGTIFYYSILLVVFSAISLSLLKFSSFLLTIGIFTFFQAYNGRRAIRNKSLRPNPVDWAVLAIAFFNGLFMIYTLNPVLFAFGMISLFLASGLFSRYRKVLNGKKISKKAWLAQHIGMMTGSYIATITAFIVVNTGHYFELFWIPWLAPTFIMVPLIVYWTRRFA